MVKKLKWRSTLFPGPAPRGVSVHQWAGFKSEDELDAYMTRLQQHPESITPFDRAFIRSLEEDLNARDEARGEARGEGARRPTAEESAKRGKTPAPKPKPAPEPAPERKSEEEKEKEPEKEKGKEKEEEKGKEKEEEKGKEKEEAGEEEAGEEEAGEEEAGEEEAGEEAAGEEAEKRTTGEEKKKRTAPEAESAESGVETSTKLLQWKSMVEDINAHLSELPSEVTVILEVADFASIGRGPVSGTSKQGEQLSPGKSLEIYHSERQRMTRDGRMEVVGHHLTATYHVLPSSSSEEGSLPRRCIVIKGKADAGNPDDLKAIILIVADYLHNHDRSKPIFVSGAQSWFYKEAFKAAGIPEEMIRGAGSKPLSARHFSDKTKKMIYDGVEAQLKTMRQSQSAPADRAKMLETGEQGQDTVNLQMVKPVTPP